MNETIMAALIGLFGALASVVLHKEYDNIRQTIVRRIFKIYKRDKNNDNKQDVYVDPRQSLYPQLQHKKFKNYKKRSRRQILDNIVLQTLV